MTIPELKDLIWTVEKSRENLALLEQPIQDLLEEFASTVRKLNPNLVPDGDIDISRSQFTRRGIIVCFVEIPDGYYPHLSSTEYAFEHILDPEGFVRWAEE